MLFFLFVMLFPGAGSGQAPRLTEVHQFLPAGVFATVFPDGTFSYNLLWAELHGKTGAKEFRLNRIDTTQFDSFSKVAYREVTKALLTWDVSNGNQMAYDLALFVPELAAKRTLSAHRDSLFGAYFTGVGNWSFRITLQPDSTYHIFSIDDVGPASEEDGRFERKGSVVELFPASGKSLLGWYADQPRLTFANGFLSCRKEAIKPIQGREQTVLVVQYFARSPD